MSPHPAPRPYPYPPATEVVMPPPAKDLSVNKILAGAGAAATTAVLGSFFGAAGTVAGAALGSVASTVATTIYQRSLDRTSQTIVARIRPVAGAGGATAPMPRLPSDEATVQLRVEPAVPPARPRRRWAVWVGATVLVFLLALVAVTGLEWIKGSAITSGDSGTSVGRVLGADPGGTAPTQGPTPETTGESTPEPTSSPEPSATPSSTADPGARSSGSDPESTSTPSTPATSAPAAP